MTYFGGFCDPNSNCIIGKYCFDVYESVTDVSVGFAAAILVPLRGTKLYSSFSLSRNKHGPKKYV